ncbi:Protein of unknown function [Pyronema omphalodes CBS 100304]|uniref:Uncharacterized protein n=1 Tax=Pyronema omphalodes (strain CBS 100304) TaxID=1076935 RepID=U4LB96_PYROM|nr:Protein of unknown function [Pyronema omphalodes CBS 100304]
MCDLTLIMLGFKLVYKLG